MTAITRRTFARGLGGLGAATLAAGRARAGAPSPLRALWGAATPTAAAAFFLGGHQLGFFKNEGLDMTVQFMDASSNAAALIETGNIDVALTSLEPLPIQVSKGGDLKTIFVYGYRAIHFLGFFEGSQVQKVENLKGAKIGVISLASSAVPLLQFMLAKAGMEPADVTLVAIGAGPSIMAAVQRKSVDALLLHDTLYADLIAKFGLKVRLYRDKDLGENYVSQGALTSDDVIARRPDQLARFARGLRRSLTFALENPKEAVKAAGEAYPALAENPEAEEKIWAVRSQMSVLPPDFRGRLGEASDIAWNNFLDVMVLSKQIPARIPIGKLFAGQFV